MVILAGHFRAKTDLPKKKAPFGIRLKSTGPSEIRSSPHEYFLLRLRFFLMTWAVSRSCSFSSSSRFACRRCLVVSVDFSPAFARAQWRMRTQNSTHDQTWRRNGTEKPFTEQGLSLARASTPNNAVASLPSSLSPPPADSPANSLALPEAPSAHNSRSKMRLPS